MQPLAIHDVSRMKRTYTTIEISLLLLAFLTFGVVLSASIVAASEVGQSTNSTLCERFPALSRLPSCRITPPPPSSDACPNVPGTQTSAPCADDQCRQQGGTWNGTSCVMPPVPPPPSSDNGRGHDLCQRYIASSSRIPIPASCDICPNVPGVQVVGQCVDKLCVDDGGTWNGSSCVMPPPPENTLALCTDGVDNDIDSHVDLADPDCENFKPKIVVIKIVINDNGGTASPSDFSLYVESELTGKISITSGATTTLPHAGRWNVGEITRAGYEPKGFGGDCAGGTPVIGAGEVKTCTITNDDTPTGSGGGAGGGASGGGGGGVGTSSFSASKPSGGGQTIAAGTNDAKIGSFTLRAGSSQGVTVNAIVIELSAANAASISDLMLKNKSTGAQIGSTEPSPSTSTTFSTDLPISAGSSITIDVYADIHASADMGTFVAVLGGDTAATGAINGASFTTGTDFNLQAMTIAHGGAVNPPPINGGGGGAGGGGN